MKWVTRSHVHVDRVACPWLISRFVDGEPIAQGLETVGVGYNFRFPDDKENIERQFAVYDALYAWCSLDVAKTAKRKR